MAPPAKKAITPTANATGPESESLTLLSGVSQGSPPPDDAKAGSARTITATAATKANRTRFTALGDIGALHGWLRHPVGGRDPQEGDDEDADNSFGRRGFGPRWAHVAPAQARCGGTPVAGGGSGDPLAGAGRHGRDPDRMAGHLCGGR